jgi:hypothetical protein
MPSPKPFPETTSTTILVPATARLSTGRLRGVLLPNEYGKKRLSWDDFSKLTDSEAIERLSALKDETDMGHAATFHESFAKGLLPTLDGPMLAKRYQECDHKGYRLRFEGAEFSIISDEERLVATRKGIGIKLVKVRGIRSSRPMPAAAMMRPPALPCFPKARPKRA